MYATCFLRGMANVLVFNWKFLRASRAEAIADMKEDVKARLMEADNYLKQHPMPLLKFLRRQHFMQELGQGMGFLFAIACYTEIVIHLHSWPEWALCLPALAPATLGITAQALARWRASVIV